MPNHFLTIFFIPLITAVALTPLARKLAFQWEIVAKPGGRRRHQGSIPKLGTIPLAGAFAVGIALIYWLLPPTNPADATLLRGLLIGLVIVFAGGLGDDFYDWPWWPQFAVQFLATAVVVYHELFLEIFTNPLTGQPIHIATWLVPIVTLFWVSGMMNTVNWLDGLDGLAAGVAMIAALIFAWHSYNLGQITIAAFPIALSGALIGLLIFNFAPAKIFLGSGASLLGYCLATLAILAPAKIATALLVLAVPILDVAWQIIDRLRRGNSPLKGDRGHLHFRLSDGGLPTRTIVLTYYTIAAVLGLIAIYGTGLWKLIMLLVLSVIVITLLLWLSKQ